MLRTILAVLALCSAPAVGLAAGWHDYELEIAPGFIVFRANSVDVCLGTTERALLICPNDYPGKVGPLVEYAVTPTEIVTKHLGIRPHPKNSEMRARDPEVEYFFVTNRSSLEIAGPLTQRELLSQLPASLTWETPSNPNVWLPLLGDLLFLSLAAVFVGWPYLLGLLAVAAAWIVWRKRGSRSAKQGAA